MNMRIRGFTMIELMMVVAVIGILATIAAPSYQDYMTRGRIPEATSSLAAKRVRIESFYDNNRTYVGATDCAADTATSTYFDFSCTAVDANSYTLQAVGKNSMAGFAYTINQANARATISVPSGWTTSANCWVTRKGGVC